MDPSAFDTLARSFATGSTRRRLVNVLTALSLGGVVTTSEDAAAGEHPRDRLQRRIKQGNRKQRHRRQRHQHNNTNQHHNGGGGGGGLGGPQDCTPDDRNSGDTLCPDGHCCHNGQSCCGSGCCPNSF